MEVDMWHKERWKESRVLTCGKGRRKRPLFRVFFVGVLTCWFSCASIQTMLCVGQSDALDLTA